MTAEFQAVWPVIDEDMTMADLVREAQDDLPGLMVRAAVDRYGPGRWEIKEGSEVPGWGTYGLVLVFSAPAEFFGRKHQLSERIMPCLSNV